MLMLWLLGHTTLMKVLVILVGLMAFAALEMYRIALRAASSVDRSAT